MTIFTRTLFIASVAFWPAGQRAPVFPAAQRAIEIWSVDPIAIDIEWLTIDDEGDARVTARRATVIGPPVPLEFTPGADRYVRFSYQGASPRTYSAAELIAAKKLHVPDVLPGGELLILVPQAPVRPVRLRLEGPQAPVIDLTPAGHLSLPGLPEGDYKIVLLYDGGVPGAVETAKVRAAHTAIAPLPVEDVGGVHVVAAHEACSFATEVNIHQLVVAKVAPEIKAPPNRVRWAVSKEPQCDMRFGGLKPGEFEVSYRTGRSPSGTAYFSVAAQAWTRTDVAPSGVRLEGRVTINGAGAAGTRIALSPRRTSAPVPPTVVETTTDPAGNYSISLDAPGTYRLSAMRPMTMFSYMREMEIVEGRNFHDVAITGGRILLDIKGWEPKTRIAVNIEGTRAGGGRTISALEWQKNQPVFDGLPFGEYVVSVLTDEQLLPSGAAFSREWRRNAQRVILTAASPAATLTFDVTKR